MRRSKKSARLGVVPRCCALFRAATERQWTGASQPAVTTLYRLRACRLHHADICPFTIAAGTAAAGTNDGTFVLYDEDRRPSVAAIENDGSTVVAAATAPGAAANGYLSGQLPSVQLMPNALITSVNDASTTDSGSLAQETDDHLSHQDSGCAKPVDLGADAGPIGAYRFFAIGADPLPIVDAQIVGLRACQFGKHISADRTSLPFRSQPLAFNSAGVANSALLAKVASRAPAQHGASADRHRQRFGGYRGATIGLAATVTLFYGAEPIATIASSEHCRAKARARAVTAQIRPRYCAEPDNHGGCWGRQHLQRDSPRTPVLTPLTAGQWANWRR